MIPARIESSVGVMVNLEGVRPTGVMVGLERVSSTAGAMVTFTSSSINEMECMLAAVTKAGEREREERAKADEATFELMAALIKNNQELARKNETLEKRVILLESAQRGSDIIHRSVLQASESRFQTEIQALQAKLDEAEVTKRTGESFQVYISRLEERINSLQVRRGREYRWQRLMQLGGMPPGGMMPPDWL